MLAKEEEAELRKQWAVSFLEHGGFEHVLKSFMECSLPEQAANAQVELQYMAFMLRLLRTFTLAAFAARGTLDAAQGATLARRASSNRPGDGAEADGEANPTTDTSSFHQL